MKFLALIPARYASTRFPGKPLADLGGKPMIRHVYEKARAFFDTCYVATDDERIERAVAGFGGRAIMTSTDHRSGTDRCREALDKAEALCGGRFDIVVNIQGDEPFVSEEQLSLISGCFDEPSTQIATLVKAFAPHEDIFQFQLSEGGLVGRRSCALFQPFGDSLPSRSRSRRSGRVRIPTISISGCMPTAATCSRKITALPQGILERCESLEQLRWLENGYRIRTAVTMTESLAIDTPQDLQAAVDYMLGRTK